MVLLISTFAPAHQPSLSLSLLSSSSCTFPGAGESEGGHGSSPSAGLHPSASVPPARARPAAAARRCQPSSNPASPLPTLFPAELCSLSWQLPVPFVMPPLKKSVKDAAVQWESQDGRRDVSVSTAGEKKITELRNTFLLSVQEITIIVVQVRFCRLCVFLS